MSSLKRIENISKNKVENRLPHLNNTKMDFWEKCKNYGLAVPERTSVRLFYDQFSSQLAITPGWMEVIDSAVWQGNHLLVRGRDAHGTRKTILMDGFYSFKLAY